MDWFFSAINNLININQTKRTIKNIQVNNSANRNVTEYQPSEIEGFFNPREAIGSIVVSGGNEEYRARATVASCVCAFNNRIPVIILHESNNCLEKKIKTTFQGANNISILNSNNPLYDPFIDQTNMEISQLVINSTQQGYEIKPNGRQYIDGILDFIKSKGVPSSCDMLIRCPHASLIDRLDDASQKGKIGSNEAKNIRNLIMQGQSERASVENFFTQLGYQGQYLLSKKSTRQKAINIKKAVNQNSLIMLDVQTSTNTVLLNIIINEIQSCLAKGKTLFLVIDTISVDSNKSLENLIKAHSSHCLTTLVSDDVYAMLGSNENLFSTIVGIAQKCIVYVHRTGITCSKWADVFGFYDIDKISHNLGSGQTANSINICNAREHRVKPQDIGSMTPNEVYVLNSSSGELAHTTII